MSRLKKAAEELRNDAARNRAVGRDEQAARQEARARELESGRVTDRTDDVLAIVRFGLRR
ncbi:hypothetical protein [Streptomyces yunnanensis]|uniref:Uncharacterized protein n=1 Tax=Streptomyces yunnanensis TaxID=156453 RepID=A0A9X8QSA3_9ACTN|nr:hypothetical protein [Streptomyces yunnanensis]SHL74731.1 hypothetical protein SAMN05216268_10660 [Streptomyces yunnanensis]